MIPIIYDKDEIAFVSNGLGRLRDCISCVVTEERNGIYECNFEYPIDGVNFDLIQCGRIIGVTHDETGDVQPFDIVGYEQPIGGVVEFHAVHVSYRQSYITTKGTDINSLADAFTLLGTGQPSNPFTYETDKTSTGFLSCANGLPHSVREMLGGIEGSILDAYGGEYEWDKFVVRLHEARGKSTDFTIRYGVNMLDYNDETDHSGCYSSCIPYWTDSNDIVVGDRVVADGTTITARGECVPLDLSDKFQTKPTKAQLQTKALSYMTSNNTFMPNKNIKVEFVRLQDDGVQNGLDQLMSCSICDTVNVVFPGYDASGNFKIVKTEWDVIQGKYQSMELGNLSMSLADALQINSGTSGGSGGGGTITEVDPVFTTSPAYGISASDISKWNSIGEGTVVNDSVSKATGTSFVRITQQEYLSLSPGRYIILVSARFAGGTNSTGNRGVALYSGDSIIDSTQVIVPAINSTSWTTSLRTVAYVAPTSNTNYYIGLLQNSGASKTVNYTLTYIKLR